MKVTLALALVCLCQLLDASPIEERSIAEKYAAHKTKHGLKFEADEDERRQAEFKATDDFINAHNSDPSKKSKLVHNKYSTMHAHEFAQINGYRPSHGKAAPVSRDIEERANPTSLDWRNHNGVDYVSPIQNQGSCGSCWTFSATATLESRHAIKNKLTKPIKLSEQNLVDCAHYGSTTANTCATGGNYGTAWAWVASTKGNPVAGITGTNYAALPKPVPGQNLESEYPYTSGSYKSGDARNSCGFSTSKGTSVTTSTYSNSYCGAWYYKWTWTSSAGWKKGAKVCTSTVTTKYASHKITANSPSAMITALQSGPVSISINASERSFQNYGSGILAEADCAGASLDHAVNLVGYGADSSGNKYWIGRNSWGTWWGDKGYFKFERKDTDSIGTCGCLKDAEYPEL